MRLRIRLIISSSPRLMSAPSAVHRMRIIGCGALAPARVCPAAPRSTAVPEIAQARPIRAVRVGMHSVCASVSVHAQGVLQGVKARRA